MTLAPASASAYESQSCGSDTVERSGYFDGKLLATRDLEQEQTYELKLAHQIDWACLTMNVFELLKAS